MTDGNEAAPMSSPGNRRVRKRWAYSSILGLDIAHHAWFLIGCTVVAASAYFVLHALLRERYVADTKVLHEQVASEVTVGLGADGLHLLLAGEPIADIGLALQSQAILRLELVGRAVRTIEGRAPIVGAAIADPAERTRLFATVDLAVNSLTLIVQLFVTARLSLRLGTGWMLALMPLAACFAAPCAWLFHWYIVNYLYEIQVRTRTLHAATKMRYVHPQVDS